MRDLLIQLLLHLPRLAGIDGIVPTDAAIDEATRLVTELSVRYAKRPAWLSPPPRKLTAKDLELRLSDDQTARAVLEDFHYLRSFRTGSDHFVAVLREDPKKVAALFSISSFDIPWLVKILPHGVTPASTSVLSRVFAFDWVPPNSISFLMSNLLHRLRRSCPGLRLLLTYVNPNLGFTGASYKASNWIFVAREEGTRYAYLHGDYLTDRALTGMFGTVDPARLRDVLDGEIEFSSMPLQPLEIYAYPVDSRIRGKLVSSAPISTERIAK